MQRISILNMKRIVTLVLIAVMSAFFALHSDAQIFGGPEYMKGKKVFGGNITGGATGNYLHVGVAPQFGLRLTRSLELGTRLGYDLYFYHDYYYGRYFCHYVSGALYANYDIISGIYLHAEDEEMCLFVSGKDVNANAPRWYNSVFVGAGYRQYAYDGSYVYYALLYNLSWDGFSGNSPYANPFVIRMGYCHAF